MISLCEPRYLNWRYGGGQSLDPPTNPNDSNRTPFEFNRPVAGGDELFDLVEVGQGEVAVRSPNGRAWLSVQPDGSLQERPVVEGQAPGPWERFERHGNVLVERPKDGITRAPYEFVVPG